MHYGVAGGFFDRVDGQVAILDYPDDHYTARWAQKRKLLPASLCQDNNIRITVLERVIHLAALGRLYTENGHLPRQHKIEAEACNTQVELPKGKFSEERLCAF